MRVLLDECLPEGLRAELPGHRVLTVRQAGLAGRKDGALLSAASGVFDVFVTVDRSLQWQQRLEAFDLGVVLIRARSNSLPTLRPIIFDLLRRAEFGHLGDYKPVGEGVSEMRVDTGLRAQRLAKELEFES